MPVAIILSSDAGEEGDEIRHLVPDAPVFLGDALRSEETIQALHHLRPDYLLSVHFPLILPESVLAIARVGALNLHPSYLPYNRGWHTPSWSILEGTPNGCTLHWMSGDLDAGDIALQREVPPRLSDTAHTLYLRTLEAELDLLAEAVPLLRGGNLPRKPQPSGGSFHVRSDLFDTSIRRLERAEHLNVGELLDRLRALTTNTWDEAAYCELQGRRILIRLEMREIDG